MCGLWVRNTGKKESSSKSKKQIKSFVDFYGIDMRLFEPEELDEYKARTIRSVPAGVTLN